MLKGVKLTRINPDGRTYRAPLVNGADIRMDGTSTVPCVFGSIINRLGEFEALGVEPEDLRRILKQQGVIK